MRNAKYYLIIDLEATCWKNGSSKSGESEIIEIGAVLVDASSFNIVDEFQSFVKPTRNPILSDFCKQLTHIEQADVENAEDFKKVLQKLVVRFISSHNPIFCSWGNYDKKQLIQDCHYHNVIYPFSDEHINLKELFSKKFRCKHMGIKGALKKLGLEFQGSHHRALDDARNIFKVFKEIMH